MKYGLKGKWRTTAFVGLAAFALAIASLETTRAQTPSTSLIVPVLDNDPGALAITKSPTGEPDKLFISYARSQTLAIYKYSSGAAAFDSSTIETKRLSGYPNHIATTAEGVLITMSDTHSNAPGGLKSGLAFVKSSDDSVQELFIHPKHSTLSGVAIDSDGIAGVTDSANQCVHFVDTNKKTVAKFGPVGTNGGNPSGIAWNGKTGKFYVVPRLSRPYGPMRENSVVVLEIDISDAPPHLVREICVAKTNAADAENDTFIAFSANGAAACVVWGTPAKAWLLPFNLAGPAGPAVPITAPVNGAVPIDFGPVLPLGNDRFALCVGTKKQGGYVAQIKPDGSVFGFDSIPRSSVPSGLAIGGELPTKGLMAAVCVPDVGRVQAFFLPK
jgi:hypothetical protein